MRAGRNGLWTKYNNGRKLQDKDTNQYNSTKTPDKRYNKQMKQG